MRRVVVLWNPDDLASKNIAESLTEDAEKLDTEDLQHYTVETWERDGVRFHLTVALGDLIKEDEARELSRKFDVIVFASRHESRTEKPSLTVHVPGNPTPEAKFGGKPLEVCTADPEGMKAALLELKRFRDKRGLDYDVCYEVTHHGPRDPGAPCFFIEIGSDERRWADEEAGEACARAILATVDPPDVKAVVGYGGGHYAPAHTDAALSDRKLAYGHIVPDYAVDHDYLRDQFLEVVDKTPRAREIIVDDRNLDPGIVERLEDLAHDRGLHLRDVEEVK